VGSRGGVESEMLGLFSYTIVGMKRKSKGQEGGMYSWGSSRGAK